MLRLQSRQTAIKSGTKYSKRLSDTYLDALSVKEKENLIIMTLASSLKSYHLNLLFAEKIDVDQFRLNGTHGNSLESESIAPLKVVLQFSWNNLNNVLNSNAKFTILIVTRL